MSRMGNLGTWGTVDKCIHLCLCSTFIKLFFFYVWAYTLGSRDTEKKKKENCSTPQGICSPMGETDIEIKVWETLDNHRLP